MRRLTERPQFETIGTCRGCQSPRLEEVLSFGDMPIADRLMRPESTGPEYVAPLTLASCGECGLCQILETVDPEVLFGRHYPYFSSVSPALVAHFSQSGQNIIRERNLSQDSLVIEAASNDGYMLDVFHKQGINVLGIDPAPGPVREARNRGVETLLDFFGEKLAGELAGKGVRADVFLANNVLAHVADTNGFISGIEILLADDGIAVLEFPYLLDLVEGRAFDTIYHQHLLYLSAETANNLFARQGLFVNDVERTDVHGGSLRVTVSKRPGGTPRLKQILENEANLGLSKPDFFADFRADLIRLRAEARAVIAKLRQSGKTIAGYGAAAKATTLLGYFDLTSDDISYIMDKSVWKQGLEMPGTGIPIVSPDRLTTDNPDAVLILAWNFAREIMTENSGYVDGGGKFLVPLPELREVELMTAGKSL